MTTASDTNRNSRPATCSWLLSATNLKKGMLYSSSVPTLTIHENAKSEIGRKNLIVLIIYFS